MGSELRALTVLAALSLAGAASQTAPAVNPEVPASEFPPTVEITRGDKKITAVQYGSDQTGLNITCGPDERGVTTSVYYDGPPYLVHVTVGKNLIRTRVAYVQQKSNGDGHLEAYNGSASESSDPNACLPVVKADPQPATVLVTQGKTSLTGSKLVYDDSNGLAVISGPIQFSRPQRNDQLRGSSDRITVNVDRETTVLEGNVKLESRCRSSTAARVEYDDTKNLAVLLGEPGKPAVSTSKDGGKIQAARIEYDLETNDVVVTDKGGGVSGAFNDDPAATCR